MNRKGALLLETVVASAIAALVVLTVVAALTTALQVADTAQAVTLARLLGQAHLELVLAGENISAKEASGLTSVLAVNIIDGQPVYSVTITGKGLLRPLVLSGRR